MVQWQSQSFSTAKLSGGVEITIQFNRMFQHLWFQAVQHRDHDLFPQVSCIAVAIVVAQVVWFIFFSHWLVRSKTILINSLQFRSVECLLYSYYFVKIFWRLLCLRSVSGVISALTELLILELRSELVVETGYNCPYNTKLLQHPLVSVLRRRPESWDDVLNQVSAVCSHQDKQWVVCLCSWGVDKVDLSKLAVCLFIV